MSFVLFIYANLIASLQALATTLDQDEIADLRDQFNAIDVDKNGVISLEEMRKVHNPILNLAHMVYTFVSLTWKPKFSHLYFQIPEFLIEIA